MQILLNRNFVKYIKGLQRSPLKKKEIKTFSEKNGKFKVQYFF